MSIFVSWKEFELPHIQGNSFYVLAEATPENKLVPQLEFHSMTYRALWMIEHQPHLEQYAPYLIEVAPDSTFDGWLTEQAQTLPVTILTSSMTFEKLWQHLRHFTKFQDENGQRYFLRLGSSPMFHTYLQSVIEEHQHINALFAQGQINGFLFTDQATQLSRFYRPFFEKHTDPRFKEQGYLLYRDLTEEALQQEVG